MCSQGNQTLPPPQLPRSGPSHKLQQERTHRGLVGLEYVQLGPLLCPLLSVEDEQLAVTLLTGDHLDHWDDVEGVGVEGVSC